MLLLGAACVQIPTEDPSSIDGLTVLAIGADAPEISPGDTTTLSALVVDDEPSGSLQYLWSVCALVAPADEELSDPSLCVDPDLRTTIGVTPEVSLIVPTDTLDDVSSQQRAAGLDAPILLHVSDGEQDVQAIKRLRISENADPNRNPAITALSIDGGAPPSELPRGQRVTVAVSVTDDEGISSEGLLVNFSVTGGTMPRARAGPDEPVDWHLPAEGAEVTLYAVARDRIGGVSWRSISFRLRD